MILVQGGILVGVAVNHVSIYSQVEAIQAYEGSEFEFISEKQVQFSGLIGNKTFQSLKKIHRESNFDTVYITSRGGIISEAKKIANFLYKNKISVVVQKQC